MRCLKASFCVGVLSVLFALSGTLFFGEIILLEQHNNTLVRAMDYPTALRVHVLVCGFESLCISVVLFATRRAWLRRRVSNRHLINSLVPS